jgi:putative FmdB family regulatory protein
MPTYQYQCDDCGHRFELRQSFNDKPVAVCSLCHGAARRLFSPVPILFKGSGFYITDSRVAEDHGRPLEGSEATDKGADKKGVES